MQLYLRSRLERSLSSGRDLFCKRENTLIFSDNLHRVRNSSDKQQSIKYLESPTHKCLNFLRKFHIHKRPQNIYHEQNSIFTSLQALSTLSESLETSMTSSTLNLPSFSTDFSVVSRSRLRDFLSCSLFLRSSAAVRLILK